MKPSKHSLKHNPLYLIRKSCANTRSFFANFFEILHKPLYVYLNVIPEFCVTKYPGSFHAGVILFSLDRSRITLHFVTETESRDSLRIVGSLCQVRDDAVYSVAIPHNDKTSFM